jgi:hypothetical protein
MLVMISRRHLSDQVQYSRHAQVDVIPFADCCREMSGE